MTQISIDKQLESIKKATQEALKSKEAAHKFLVDAGIINDKKNVPPSQKPVSKK